MNFDSGFLVGQIRTAVRISRYFHYFQLNPPRPQREILSIFGSSQTT